MLTEGCTAGGDNEIAISSFQGRILFHCAGVTFLTLICNGTTTGALVKWLKLGLQTAATQHTFDRVCQIVTQKSETMLGDLTAMSSFKNMDVALVWDLLPVFNDEILKERPVAHEVVIVISHGPNRRPVARSALNNVKLICNTAGSIRARSTRFATK